MRAVVVGTGFGARVHVPALRMAGIDVVALVGRDAARTHRRGDRLGVEGYTSLAPAIELAGAAGEPVVVTIATPPHTHALLAMEATSAGCHVICEKPMALDAAEARAMRTAAARADVLAVLGHEFRWAPHRATLGRALAEGAIGRPRLITMVEHVDLIVSPATKMPEWWFDTERGGGWLGASGSHVLDQLRAWAGDVASVSGSLGVVAPRAGGADDTFSARLTLASGAEAVVQQTAAAWGPAISVCRVVGDGGALWLDGTSVWRADSSGVHEVPVPEDLQMPSMAPANGDHHRFTHLELGPWSRLAEAVHKAILGEAAPVDPTPATFDDGVAVMEIIDAIRRSAAADGKRIAL